jgi:hypothetical protein
VFYHARKFFVGYLYLMLALLVACSCYFAFSGTNETEYEGLIGTPDSIARASVTQVPEAPPVPEGLQDDYDLLDIILTPPEPEDTTGGTPPDTLP